MSYRSLGSDEVTLRNYRPVGRRKGNMSLSDPLAAGVAVDLHKPGLSGIGIRLPRRRLISARYFIKKTVEENHQVRPWKIACPTWAVTKKVSLTLSVMIVPSCGLSVR